MLIQYQESGNPVDSPAQLAIWLTKYVRDDPQSVELVLCDAVDWGDDPSDADIIASIIAPQNGYTPQDVRPTADAVVEGNKAVITFADAIIGLTSGTLCYTGFAIILDKALPVYAYSFARMGSLFDGQIIDATGDPHVFSGIKISHYF